MLLIRKPPTTTDLVGWLLQLVSLVLQVKGRPKRRIVTKAAVGTQALDQASVATYPMMYLPVDARLMLFFVNDMILQLRLVAVFVVP